MNKFFGILHWISAGNNEICRSILIKKYSEDLVDECLRNGYIYECGKNTYGEPLYRISDIGRKKRDE